MGVRSVIVVLFILVEMCSARSTSLRKWSLPRIVFAYTCRSFAILAAVLTISYSRIRQYNSPGFGFLMSLVSEVHIIYR